MVNGTRTVFSPFLGFSYTICDAPAHLAAAHPSSEYRRCTRSLRVPAIFDYFLLHHLVALQHHKDSRLEYIDNLCSMQDFVEPISERDII
ncbi:hypothetical protein L1987_88049 [Smallanthus sonchifolius]|nr:hypothetical protein L1987_88049 [Smallanthus sonchifolius]